MNDTLTDAIESSAAEPVDFDLDRWIDGISPAQRSVSLYGRPDLFARYEAIAREIEVAEKVVRSDDAGIEDQERLRDLYDEREDLFAQQQASKTVWYVQALADEVTNAIQADFPIPDALEEPVAPDAPSDRATASTRARYEAALARYRKDKAAFDKKNPKRTAEIAAAADLQNMHFIAAALVRIENADGDTVATSIDIDQLRRIHAKPHGAQQIAMLAAAAYISKAQEPLIPAPFSPASLKGTPD